MLPPPLSAQADIRPSAPLSSRRLDRYPPSDALRAFAGLPRRRKPLSPEFRNGAPPAKARQRRQVASLFTRACIQIVAMEAAEEPNGPAAYLFGPSVIDVQLARSAANVYAALTQHGLAVVDALVGVAHDEVVVGAVGDEAADGPPLFGVQVLRLVHDRGAIGNRCFDSSMKRRVALITSSHSTSPNSLRLSRYSSKILTAARGLGVTASSHYSLQPLPWTSGGHAARF
jgi:hypothetical protein